MLEEQDETFTRVSAPPPHILVYPGQSTVPTARPAAKEEGKEKSLQ